MADFSRLPEELTEALRELDWYVGKTRRIMHKECSEGKSPALSIIRKSDGWWFYCFRCKKLKGFVGDHQKSPEEVKIMLENLKKDVAFHSQSVIYLPDDCIPMIEAKDDGVPHQAYTWVWDARLTKEDLVTHNFQWSPSYQRVIMPIYEYAVTEELRNEDSKLAYVAHKLIGWVGREVMCKTKKDREQLGIPKYITRKSSEYEHINFHAPNFQSDKYAVVEDVLSAIRVSRALKCNAIALLTTYFPIRLMLKLRKQQILLWLDNDMKQEMLTLQTRLSHFKIPSRIVFSGKDPKSYNDLAIRQLASGEIKGGTNATVI